MKELILIDFSWVYNRYYFVADSRGEGNAKEVSSMLSQFLHVVERSYPESRVILAMDSPTKLLYNYEIFNGYKQNRDSESKKKVYSIINEVAKSLCKVLPTTFAFAKAPKFEADQIIAHYAEKYKDKAEKVIIYSGDKDLLQLTYYTNVYVSNNFSQGSFSLFTDENIFEKFKNSSGVPFTRISDNKADILKYRTLKGDTSDNLSPVFPRIKDKEIVTIIKEHWQGHENLSEEKIDAIIESIRESSPNLANKLSENKGNWLRNYKIMNLYGVENIEVRLRKCNG